MITLADIRAAQARLKGITIHTRLIEFKLSEGDPRRLFLKPENQQPIGAFKLRGAYNKIAFLVGGRPQARRHLLLQRQSRAGRGLRGARAGREGRHRHAQQRSRHQARGNCRLGADIVLSRARQRRTQNSKPRNWPPSTVTSSCLPTTTSTSSPARAPWDWRFSKICPTSKPFWHPVGGGGLISGVAAAIKLSKPSVNVFGVEPELAADAQASLRAGKIVQFPAEQVSRTLADGLAHAERGQYHFDHMQCFVDGIITVSEDEIRQAMKLLAANPATVAEPSGAVAVAGFLFHADQVASRRS
jgi:hypothetical protein